ncbi:MAG: transcription termination factor Rho [Puniceicoccales bacterium]|nr:transcription termination factor Rho [Puniceicoccales bacterium]
MPVFENTGEGGEPVFSFDERHSGEDDSCQTIDGGEDRATGDANGCSDGRPQRRNFGRGDRGRDQPQQRGSGRGKVQVLPEDGSMPPDDPFADGGRDGGGGDQFSNRGNHNRFGQNRFRNTQQRQQNRQPLRGGTQQRNGANSTGRGPAAPLQQNALNMRKNRYGGLGYWERIQSEASIADAALEFFGETTPLDLDELFRLGMEQIAELATSMDLECGECNRHDVLDRCLRQASENHTAIAISGVLEIFFDGNGCLVGAENRFQPGEWSPFVPRCLIRANGLRRGQKIRLWAAFPRSGAPHLCALKIDSVMDSDPESAKKFPQFKELTPFYPRERILLENSIGDAAANLSMRIVDLVTPIGLGQRGLIVAPPRTGKTVLLQAFANAIAATRPDVEVWILLIDERPEEVTDFRRMAKGEVFASTFDETPDRHIQLAEMVIEMARRRVECGRHVVILLDSITRLARAYNSTMPASGRVMSGGIDANALQGPKSFFGSARNIEGGGSLTILGTALIETGSRMDDVIFEEFKGTGNMELHLDRELSDRRIYPAINVGRSGTRKEELLYHPEELPRIHLFRRAMVGLTSTDAVEMLIQRVKKTSSNVEFLMTLNRT